jgi:DNA polymerase III epsilon subunit-like protein
MLALVFDTETTGLANYQKPNLDPKQPHLVQIAAILGDPDTGRIYGRIDSMIIPEMDGYTWTIPEKATEIHGITTNDAYKYGVYMPAVIETFLDMVEAADVLVAHNIAFDAKIIEIACARIREYSGLSKKHGLQFADPLGDANLFCTLKAAKADPKIANTSSRGTNLTNLHKQLLGYEFEDAHLAYNDTEALWRVFCEMNKRAAEAHAAKAAAGA